MEQFKHQSPTTDGRRMVPNRFELKQDQSHDIFLFFNLITIKDQVIIIKTAYLHDASDREVYLVSTSAASGALAGRIRARGSEFRGQFQDLWPPFSIR